MSITGQINERLKTILLSADVIQDMVRANHFITGVRASNRISLENMEDIMTKAAQIYRLTKEIIDLTKTDL